VALRQSGLSRHEAARQGQDHQHFIGNDAQRLAVFLHYVSSKAAVVGFTRALAREVGNDNICVNSIMPGLTISGSNQEGVMTAEQLADRRKRRAIQRDQYPQDLVGTVIFLSSDDSDFMTGQAIAVDGGMNMY